MATRRIVATGALPYANGHIHIGHLVEYLQADFWTRFQKMRGHECLYLCADDTHGTPIMVKARELGVKPEDLIAKSGAEHIKDFNDFQIEFDHYSSTNSLENKELCEEFYHKINAKKHFTTRSIEQLYCPHDKMFLPDRFVKGTCPNCKSANQYGDSCDNCGATYAPKDLKSPACAICGTEPILKNSEHVFFKLNDFKKFLLDWVPKHTGREVGNKMMEWFKEDLRDWDISRDEPYFGFAIPGFENKYFYVWVDAPIGYISTLKQWCKLKQKDFKNYWPDENTEIYHFIGKDITYFHTLFWPAMLKAADYREPTQVFVHGFLTVNGEKMSKSKGTFISARTYLKHLDPTYLRYYYACKISGTLDDIDLNLEDFVQRVNSDLVGKITNLGSRGAQMLKKRLSGRMSNLTVESKVWLAQFRTAGDIIAQHFEDRDFSKATNEIRALADEANRYFDEKAPWKLINEDPEATREVLSVTLNVFRLLSIYLKPVLPHYTAKVEQLFGESPYTWNSTQVWLENHLINDYEHLATRIESDKVKAMIEDSKTGEVKTSTPNAASPAAAKSELIKFDDFAKVDLRIAKIIEAEEIKEADKLLRLKVDLGGETRQIIAGIKSAYKAEDLVGRLTVIVANLEPRKMKFGVSEGMVLAAGAGGKELFIMSPDSGAKPGDKVK